MNDFIFWKVASRTVQSPKITILIGLKTSNVSNGVLMFLLMLLVNWEGV